MIHDGYNRFADIRTKDGETLRIVYRPALDQERLELANRLYFLDDESQTAESLGLEIEKRVLNFEWIPGNQIFAARDALIDAVLGRNPKSTEKEDAENLRHGVRLLVEHPEMQNVNCDDCRKWQMDPLTGKISVRGGKPLERLPEDVLLCDTARGCPKGTWKKPFDLSIKNQLAFNHYLECRAIGQFPDDAIVRRNAAIIANEMTNARFTCFSV